MNKGGEYFASAPKAVRKGEGARQEVMSSCLPANMASQLYSLGGFLLKAGRRLRLVRSLAPSKL